jgi:hypothetical protein
MNTRTLVILRAEPALLGAPAYTRRFAWVAVRICRVGSHARAAHQGADHSDYEARMRGQGDAEGSISKGGILRASATIVPVK